MRTTLILLLTLACWNWNAWGEMLRQKVNINREWKFKLGDYPGAETIPFDDFTWQAVNLPHSFEIPYFQWKDFYVGYGWYRKKFDIQPAWASKRMSLEFEGAFQDAEVFVNGMRVGEHRGGFTGFSMDITSAVHPGENVLAVRLNNNWNPKMEPRSGDHTFMGGIYRNVYLVVTDPLHVTWYGTFITTPEITQNSATIHVSTEIANEAKTDANCTLITDILGPKGEKIAHLADSRTISAGTTITINQLSPAIPNPALWSPSSPVLYTAQTTVLNGATPVDDYLTTFGIRSITWTADQGFFLNGQHYYFHGANVHQDHAGWGDAVTESGSYRDVKLIKDAGLDFIRGSHYPHHPAFATACDKLGVLFWSENCFWGMGRGKKEGSWVTADAYPPNPEDQAAFEQNAADTLRDEIRILRNHPSIVVWSMCNEVFFSDNQDKVKGLLAKLVNESHKLDPTRPAAIGGCQRGGLDKIGDVAGYNGDGASMKEFQNPGIANAVSEYGSHISDRGNPKSDTYDGMFNARELGPATPEYPWRSGQALWCAFDYSTVLGHFGCMGFVDYFRIPKKSWYWYRNQYLHIPPPDWPQPGTAAKLALTSDKTTIEGTDAVDDCQLLITVQDASGKPISNSPPVTLTIESGPGEFPTGRAITFYPPSSESKSDIAIRDGLAAIEFRSYFAGKSVIRATSPGLEDGVITISTTGEPVFVPGQSPLAPNRPYSRYSSLSPTQVMIGNIALNHPSTASSEAHDHPPRMANDGSLSTAWQAADASSNPWWQVDLEALYSIATIETIFGNRAAHQYKIEGSTDNQTWTVLVDQTRNSQEAPTYKETCRKNQGIRFVRLTLTEMIAGEAPPLEEIKVQGQTSP